MLKDSGVICSFALLSAGFEKPNVLRIVCSIFLTNSFRLRYIDTPSSPGDIGCYRDSTLPQTQVAGTTRPTLSNKPLGDDELTRRLFSPIS